MSRSADWVIAKAYLKANRKATPPTSGSSKYEALLDIVDSMQKQWADEEGIDWNSLFELTTLVPLITETDTFALPATVDYISKRSDDYILVTDGTSTKTFSLIQANQLYKFRDQDACAQVGRNLVFSRAFTSTSPELGYSIKVPAYNWVDDIEDGTDIVQVDRPMWLAYASAAEFVRNDIVKSSQYDNLLALAEQVMNKMKYANGGQVEELVTEWQPAGGDSWA